VLSRADLPPKYVGETKDYEFDFVSELAEGETISSATVSASVYSGTDATPSNIISGADSTSGTIVTQRITGGVLGVIYILLCEAVTSAGQTLRMYGLLTVVPTVPAAP
jgi:hypothetical protein